MKFGEKVANLLSLRGWSQNQLARKVSVSSSTISNIVSGADTTQGVALSIARALDTSLLWLCDDSQGLPPPLTRAEPKTDGELVIELAQRRAMVRRDIETIANRYARSHDLAKFEEVHARAFSGNQGQRSAEDEDILRAVHFDFHRLEHLYARLAELNPDAGAAISIPTTPDELVVGFPLLEKVLLWVRLEPRGSGGLWGQAGPEYGAALPAAGGYGHTISRAEFDRLSVMQQYRYLPVLTLPLSDPPQGRVLNINHGQRAPAEVTEFVRSPNQHRQAFGFRVVDEKADPHIPAGSIIVCQFGDDAGKGVALAMLCVSDDGNRASVFRIVLAGGLQGFSAPVGARQYPVVEYYPPFVIEALGRPQPSTPEPKPAESNDTEFATRQERRRAAGSTKHAVTKAAQQIRRAPKPEPKRPTPSRHK